MSQAGRAAKKISPIAGIAAAGLTAGAAGVWAWRSRGNADTNDEPATPTQAPTPTPTPNPNPEMQRTGPMVAVYLDNASVEKLHQEYPGTNPGRLRKVVIQYNPSDEQRGLYDAHFGGLATVKLTGEASSENRLALLASVSNAGNSVEPQSLTCAVDVTPGDVGGGPLASTVLMEQVKRAGVLTEESWKGPLPVISAHERDFPSEEGSYDKLDEPLTLTGSICRADWVEGKTGLCRTTTAGGGKRKDGWTPQACTICNTLEASPCRDIYKIFDSMSKRINELQPPDESPSEDNSSSETLSDSSSEISSADDDERGVAEARGVGGEDKQPRKNESRAGSDGKAGAAGMTAVAEGDKDAQSDGEGESSLEGKGEQSKTTIVEEGTPEGDGSLVEKSGEGLSKVPESEEDRMRREEVDMLENKRAAVMLEMLTCSQFHHVFEDSNADDGFVPDMSGDDDEGDGDARSGASSSEGSEAEEGGSSGIVAEEKETKEDGQQQAVDESAQK